MMFELHWTDEAEISYSENISYLKAEWDSGSLNKFLQRVDDVLLSISQNPEIYPIHKESERIHKCVINKHVSLYFRIINPTEIHLDYFLEYTSESG